MTLLTILIGLFGWIIIALLYLIFAAMCSIADSLAKMGEAVTGLDYHSVNNNITQLAWEAGRSFQHGTRTDK